MGSADINVVTKEVINLTFVLYFERCHAPLNAQQWCTL